MWTKIKSFYFGAEIGRSVTLALITLFAMALTAPDVKAEGNCRPKDFSRVMDETGARLNRMALTNSSKIRLLSAKLKTAGLGAASTANSPGQNEVLLSRAAQAKVNRYNTTIDGLINRMDRLGDLTIDPSTGCKRLDDLKLTSANLLRIQEQRFALINRDLSTQLLPPAPTKTAVATKAEPKSKPVATPKTKPKAKAKAKANAQSTIGPKVKWTTTTTTEPRSATPPGLSPQQSSPAVPTVPSVPALPALSEPSNVEETFSIAEINAAGRGFFGTISTSLANVINYTFQKIGRPTGYILGREGGGAFIAGLRYGKGRLVMKRFAARQKVYWRGPSLGYDAGAEGSRTMFLIYNLHEPKKLFRRFTGADGAAYLVGGVGITFLTNGKIVLAPIRSGIGVRLGASIGYLKFSARPGWNPF